jgi:hypothetical protein
MAGERWGQARQALMGVAETAAPYDDQGVDVYFLNSKRVGKELRSSADVEDLFAGLEPRGATPSVSRVPGGLIQAEIQDWSSIGGDSERLHVPPGTVASLFTRSGAGPRQAHEPHCSDRWW